jgi:hypothetical protein
VAKNSDKDGRFTSRTIRQALVSLEPSIGRATVEAIMYDFEMYGLPLVNEHQEYSLAEIKVAIEKIFGEAAPLFTERLVRALNAVTE